MSVELKNFEYFADEWTAVAPSHPQQVLAIDEAPSAILDYWINTLMDK